jgi:hypothetical protein
MNSAIVDKSTKDAMKMRFGPTWNKTGKGTRPAPMEKLLTYLAKLFDDMPITSGRGEEFRQKSWNEAAIIMEEVLGRSPPKEIETAMKDLDSGELRSIVKDLNAYSSERCWYCGTELDSEDYITHTEKENYWGAPAYRKIVEGYTCHNCGEQG